MRTLIDRLELLEGRDEAERTAMLYDAAVESDGFEAAAKDLGTRIRHARGKKLAGIIGFLEVSAKRAKGGEKKALSKLLKTANGKAA